MLNSRLWAAFWGADTVQEQGKEEGLATSWSVSEIFPLFSVSLSIFFFGLLLLALKPHI